MYQLCCDAYVHKQGGSGCRLGRARYGTCCALNKLLLLSRVKYHQIGFDIGAATQKGAIINKPCGVMASIYRHRSQMARLNGSSGAAAAAHKLSLRCTIYMYTGARACLRSVHKAEQSVRCQSNADYITLNQLEQELLLLIRRRILHTHSV